MLKDIAGYEGLYAVNEKGQVWSYRSNKFLTPYDDGYGYLKVGLFRNCIADRRRVHRLVMETFNPVEGMENLEVNHLDEDKKNNNLSNLSWVTKLENIRYGTGSQRSAQKRSKPVEQYTKDGQLVAVFPSMNEAYRQTGIYPGSISMCCNGKARSANGYVWRFAMENKEKQLRKTLGMKCTQDFYDEVSEFTKEKGMTISNLIRIALKETYDLEEAPIVKGKKPGLPE